MAGIIVRLTLSEAQLGATIGVQRQLEALAKGLPDKHGFDGLDGWSKHVEGACGELAVAKAMNAFWGGTVNTFKQGGDIGASVQVRTRSQEHYELIVRQDDRDEDTFVLVVGRVPRFRVVGWILGRDAKRGEWLQTHGGRPAAYFVPQHALREFPLSKSARS